ncbi:MAG: glycosyltransferase family 2 protein [Chitinophagaceae bacterium]|nr:glycosyltransferase family 2 protein [Chitinophagaceae bacterium]
MITFSIITVCFNSEKTIERTFKSVLCQTYPHIEYIVVDGASTDGTIGIIKKYAPLFKEKKIDYKWVSEKDRGIYDAMNKGIDIATGDYLNFMNSDDEFVGESVLEQVQNLFMSKYRDVDVFCGAVNYIIEKYHKKNTLYSTLDIRSIYGKDTLRHQGTFYQKKIFDTVGKYDISYKIAGDYEHFLRILHSKADMIMDAIIIANMFSEGVSSNSLMPFRLLELKEKRKILKNYYLPQHGVIKTIAYHLRYDGLNYLYAIGIRNPVKQLYWYFKRRKR